MTARVFVPLVGANGEGQQLFEAIADAETPEPHPARLTPQISELFDFGLYGIGQTVREAVTRFIAKRREGLWLSRRNAQITPWRLRISDLQVGRLSDENARSAGFGLAAAAICQAFGRAPDLVFATGEIVLPTAPGALTAAIGAASFHLSAIISPSTVRRSRAARFRFCCPWPPLTVALWRRPRERLSPA